jgi:hypothetical protein
MDSTQTVSNVEYVDASAALGKARQFVGYSHVPASVRANWRARLFSLAALSAFGVFIFYAGLAAYQTICDSFIAPIILSPDSDLVIQSKLNLLRLLAERKALDVSIEESQGAIKAADQGLTKLRELEASVPKGLQWSDTITSNTLDLNSSDVQLIAKQKTLLDDNIVSQEAYVEEMKRNLEVGLVRKIDYIREKVELGRLRIATLQKDRERLAIDAQSHQSSLAQEALRHKSSKMAMPEILAGRDQLVRLEVESLKLQQEKRVKNAELRAAREQASTLDQMIAQMKGRPVFRAIGGEQNIAFVPYTQIEGVVRGASVFECRVWGIFSCRKVGNVIELLPGEVALQDPWGTPARGQYAALQLAEKSAAKAKVLRVRRPDGGNTSADRTPIAARKLPIEARAASRD